MRKMNTVLITGVAGFIGSHVAERFLAENYTVFGVDDLSNGRMENIPNGVKFLRADLTKVEDVNKLPKGCETILHLAGQSSGEISFDNPVEDIKKNTVSTLHLVRYGIENNCKKLVYASSMSVYGSVPDEPVDEETRTEPLSCYGVGKIAAEKYLSIYENKLPYIILRLFNVYGQGQDLSNLRQGMVSIYLAMALADNCIQIKGGLDRFRDFIYIEDVVEAWFRSATYDDVYNCTINVGTGKRTTVQDLIGKICKEFPGCTYTVEGSTPGDQTGIYANADRLKNLLQIEKFTDLDRGLRSFANWARKKRNEQKVEEI